MKSELEIQLNNLAQKAFLEHSFNFTPLFPNVLIRVFDFEDTKQGLIWKPSSSQAPNHRAIVVRTWLPKQVGDYTVTSELEEGDIVTVPYYCGVPTGVESLDDAGYRIVPENTYRDKKTGRVIALGATQETPHIFLKQGMFDKRAAAYSLIETATDTIDYDAGIDTDINKTIDRILADYDIVPKRKSLV